MPSLFDTVTDLIDAELQDRELDEELRGELTADRATLIDHDRVKVGAELDATAPDDGRCRICLESRPCSITRQIAEKYI